MTNLGLKNDEMLINTENFLESISNLITSLESESTSIKDIIPQLGAGGYLSMNMAKQYGGQQLPAIIQYKIHELFGKCYISLQNTLTVYSMVISIIAKCGNEAQKSYFLPKLAKGELIGAFGLTEPDVGSNISEIQTLLLKNGDGTFTLNGIKKWITLGAIADFYIVFSQYGNDKAIVLVERNTTGLTIKPINNILGLRANALAEIRFDNCQLILQKNIISLNRYRYNSSVLEALNFARFTTACGAVGLSKACLESIISYTKTRKQSGVFLKDHQLVKRIITEISTEIEAAELLTTNSAYHLDSNKRNMVKSILMSKYFSSQVAKRSADKALQIHGANGVSKNYSVERYYRDAKIFEIIEGTTQVHEILIANEILKGQIA